MSLRALVCFFSSSADSPLGYVCPLLSFLCLFLRVKLGMHEETGVRYAVKIMAKSRISTASLTIQVRREVAVMKALRHRNIVRLYEVLTSSKHIYLVMELVTGGELFDIISDRGRLSEPDGRVYFQQLVCGIDYCHRRLVYHRDLKPENLMLSEDGALKIVDFGLSSIKSANSGTELLHTVCGTPHYTSPEVITSAKEGYDGAKFDVWSSGIILYGMLCGFLPFDEDSERALYDAIVKDQLIFPSHLSTGVKEVLSGMLEKDPDVRWSFADVKKHPWFMEGFAGEEDDASVPTSSSTASGAEATEDDEDEARRRRRKKVRSKKKRLDAAGGGISSDRSSESQELTLSGGGDTASSASLSPATTAAVAASEQQAAAASSALPRSSDSSSSVVKVNSRQPENKKVKAGASGSSRASRPAEGSLAAAAAARAPKAKPTHRHRGRSRSPAPADHRASPTGNRRAPSESGRSAVGVAVPVVAVAAAAAAVAGAAGTATTPRGKHKGSRGATGRHPTPVVPKDQPSLAAAAEVTPTSPISPPGSAVSPAAADGGVPRRPGAPVQPHPPSAGRAATSPGAPAGRTVSQRLREALSNDVDIGGEPLSSSSATSSGLVRERLAVAADDVDGALDDFDGVLGADAAPPATVEAQVANDVAPARAGGKDVLASVASITDIQSLRFFLPPEALQAVARNKNPLLSRLRGRTPGMSAECATSGAPRFVLE